MNNNNVPLEPIIFNYMSIDLTFDEIKINKTIKELLYETCDNKDPISQTILWINENGDRKIIYPEEEFNNIRFYYESNTILRCFEIESLRYLKTYNIFKHPISGKNIPLFMFNDIEIFDNKNIPINILASDVFKLFIDMFIFIDHELFLLLSKEELIKFHGELKSFWINNFSIDVRHHINPTLLNHNNIYNLDFVDLQRFLLNELKCLLECENEHKTMITHIIIAALSTVIIELRTEYQELDFML